MSKKKTREGKIARHLPQSFEKLNELIAQRYPELSPRLQQVAQYVVENPSDMAMETLAVIAERCKVQPSTVVRFAKALGYDGSTQMQRLFRDKLLEGNVTPNYQERLRRAQKVKKKGAKAASLTELLHEIADSNIVALDHLHDNVSEQDMRDAVNLIKNADTVYVTGLRRSFPVASFISYILSRFGKRTCFIDGVGGLETVQSEMARDSDLLIAISYKPYASETFEFVTRVSKRKAKIIVITDSQFSPLVNMADIAFTIHDADVLGFRSLSASLSLAQALVLGFALEAQLMT